MHRRVARWIQWIAVLTAGIFLADATVSIAAGAYLNLGSGVWLALARDAHDGVFYRELWSAGGYGGTRYLPVLFVAIAALMTMGVPAVPAGIAVSVAGFVALIAAVFMLLRRLDVSAPFAALGAALVAAPYFVHQTALAIRCEPIAAAFAVFGLAAIARLDRARNATASVAEALRAPAEGQASDGNGSTRRIAVAAFLFAVAFATKITCVYGPVAATAALLIAGRSKAALRLAALTAAMALVFLALVHGLSGGRALESFRACALAGSSAWQLLRDAFSTRTLRLIATSHLLTVIFGLTAVALIVWRRRVPRLPILHVAAAAAMTAVVFASPGTILTSQILDLYVAAIVFLVVVTARARGRVQAAASGVLIAVAVWAAAQNVVRVAGMLRQDAVQSGMAGRRQLIAAVDRCGGPLLAESPLVPVMAGRNPVLLDPFAFHVVALNRPDIGRDLAERVSRREFACIVLEQDPATVRGRAWYQNVNLTGDVIEAVLQQYQYDVTIGGQRIYRPNVNVSPPYSRQ